ncbi:MULTISPECIES: FMN-binding negative transcriptional regulator [Saccharothrix]|uniref:FMN-binding negative transcriptional regulator n=1 Tax=Saccharothrix TaxID=2071 RepID=UPI000940071F|nr:FMN-binding negative transcriptional regulator [Saccharothrix sp. CB00851]OKI20841.1 transcriptional regulator [Saccharothrix sp. CB00851]
MYVPAHFAPDDDSVRDLLRRHGAADLITATDQGLVATFLPFVHDDEARVLRGHLARNNEQWRLPVVGEGMVIVRGPDAYVSPSWYAGKAEHGRVVPTWNYITAHVYGQVTFHDDPDWVGRVVRELTAKHEAGRERPWAVDDAPGKFIDGQLRAVVGVEVAITRVEAKWKLSQNRPAADVDGVVAGLRAEGDNASADAVDRARRQPDAAE